MATDAGNGLLIERSEARAGCRTTASSGALLGVSVVAWLLAVGSMGVLVATAWAASGCSGGMPTMMSHEEMGRMMGGGRDSSSDAPRQGSAVKSVTIDDFAFSPGNLRVPVGATITWVNRDGAPHSATDSAGSWDTGVLARDERASITFDAAGTFDYFCSVHPSMKARLVVE